MATFDELVAKYKSLPPDTSERDRALFEREIMQSAAATVLRGERVDRRKWIAERLGVSGRILDDHSALLNFDDVASKLWRRCDDDMTVTTALAIARAATVRSVSDRVSLQEAVDCETRDYDARPFVSRIPGSKKIIRKKSPAGLSREPQLPQPPLRRVRAAAKKPKSESDDEAPFRAELRALVSRHVQGRLGSLDPMLIEETWRALEVDLKAVLDLHSSKIDRLRRTHRERAQLVNRRRLADAFRALNMDPPRAGDRIDLDAVKRQFRKLVGKYHPDKSGTESTQTLYQQVVEASGVIEEYCAQQSALGATNH